MNAVRSSHAITADLSMEDWMHAAEFSLADGVVLTGRHTGDAPPGDTLAREIPLLNSLIFRVAISTKQMYLGQKREARHRCPS